MTSRPFVPEHGVVSGSPLNPNKPKVSNVAVQTGLVELPAGRVLRTVADAVVAKNADDGIPVTIADLVERHNLALGAAALPHLQPQVDRRELLKLFEREGVTTTRVMGELAYRQELADHVLALLSTEETCDHSEYYTDDDAVARCAGCDKPMAALSTSGEAEK